MSHEPPDHLKSRFRCYALWLESDYGSRPNQEMMIVHIGRPLSFRNFCEAYVFQHMELTIEKTGVKITTNRIRGIQKIDDNNTPNYELTFSGQLLEIA